MHGVSVACIQHAFNLGHNGYDMQQNNIMADLMLSLMLSTK